MFIFLPKSAVHLIVNKDNGVPDKSCLWLGVFRSVYDLYQVRSREDQVSWEIWENRAALSYNLQTLVYTCTFTLGNGHPCKDSSSNFSTLYRGNLRLISQQENGLFGVPSRFPGFYLYAQGYSARTVNCSCVFSTFILKPVLSGRTL